MSNVSHKRGHDTCSHYGRLFCTRCTCTVPMEIPLVLPIVGNTSSLSGCRNRHNNDVFPTPAGPMSTKVQLRLPVAPCRSCRMYDMMPAASPTSSGGTPAAESASLGVMPAVCISQATSWSRGASMAATKSVAKPVCVRPLPVQDSHNGTCHDERTGETDVSVEPACACYPPRKRSVGTCPMPCRATTSLLTLSSPELLSVQQWS